VGDLIGVRGPFGTDWGIGDLDRSGGGDIVVVAGGIGLAPCAARWSNSCGRGRVEFFSSSVRVSRLR